MATWQPDDYEGVKKLRDVRDSWWVPGYKQLEEVLRASGALSEIERLTKALEELEMELQDANEHVEMLENS